ncbi:MAG TPA: hypothetical protein VIN70_08170 [Candidatus Limnocylindria bacterium]
MENDPRRRRSRGGRRRGAGGAQERRPTRAPAEPKPPQAARGLARRDRPQRRRAAAPPRSPDDLRNGTPCVIVMDCREGEPDRTGAAAVFEGFFDLETGDPRRAGYGVPRLRVVRPAASPPAPAEPGPAVDPAAPSSVRPGPAVPAPAEPQSMERLWGFECWWRPDPGNAGLTDVDRVEVEQSKKLLRGLIRDSRRSTRPAIAR